FCREVGNMNDAAIKNGDSVRVAAVEAVRVSSPSELEPLGRDTHGGDKTNGISQETDDGCSEGSTQSGAALGNRVEHRLGISQRPADDAEHLSGGRLLGSCLC